MAEPTIEGVIATYVKLRGKKEELEASVKEEVGALRDKMSKLEAWIQAKADETGVKSFKTDAGTAFLTHTDYASVADWDATLDWVKRHEAWDVLTKGVSKAAVREHMQAEGEVVPGVTFGTKITVGVRRPTRKE